MNCPRCQRPMPPGNGRVCDACASGLPGASSLARNVEAMPADHPMRLRLLRFGLRSLIEARQWDDLEAALTDLSFLEAKAEAGLAFDLVGDFAEALLRLPVSRPMRRILELLEEALRRDLYIIARYPSALFQCLWNSGWWYDGPETAQHYDPPPETWGPDGLPWLRKLRLAPLLESWHRAREERTPDFTWLRSLRPPSFPLGSPQRRPHPCPDRAAAFPETDIFPGRGPPVRLAAPGWPARV